MRQIASMSYQELIRERRVAERVLEVATEDTQVRDILLKQLEDLEYAIRVHQEEIPRATR